MEDDKPRVFGNGDVTLCVSRGAFRLYVGQTEIKRAHEVSVHSVEGLSLPLFEVGFQQVKVKDEALAVEEEIRVCQAFPWIRVTR